MHAHRLDHVGAACVVVPDRLRFRDVDPSYIVACFRRRLPRAMWRLVVAQQRERTVRVAPVEPVDAIVGDQIGHVAARYDRVPTILV